MTTTANAVHTPRVFLRTSDVFVCVNRVSSATGLPVLLVSKFDILHLLYMYFALSTFYVGLQTSSLLQICSNFYQLVTCAAKCQLLIITIKRFNFLSKIFHNLTAFKTSRKPSLEVAPTTLARINNSINKCLPLPLLLNYGFELRSVYYSIMLLCSLITFCEFFLLWPLTQHEPQPRICVKGHFVTKIYKYRVQR